MQKLRKPKDNDIILRIPKWLTHVYIVMGAILMPWTAYLSGSLDSLHISHNWDTMWIGFDVIIIFFLLLTGILAYTRSLWVVITASATGALLLADAWFDVMTERAGHDAKQAIFLAFFIEIPVALMSFYLARSTLKHNNNLPRYQKHQISKRRP